jgi:hypothetical protein
LAGDEISTNHSEPHLRFLVSATFGEKKIPGKKQALVKGALTSYELPAVVCI